jgi:protein-S-isoprenylcysteine O-methyltransferase Ste14
VSLTSRVAISLGGSVLYLGLAIFAIGGFGPYFSHPPLIALTAVFLVLTIAAFFAGGNLSPGIREARENRWVLVVVSFVGLLGAFVPAWTDRVGFLTIDGDAIRWAGVALVAAGGALRIAPVYVLGHRFSGLAAIQPNHTLVTGGLYGMIRHPSYLGLLIMALGWALAFRSIIGILLALSYILPIHARMNAEEALLQSQFGEEYDAYRARTSRLIPGVY